MQNLKPSGDYAIAQHFLRETEEHAAPYLVFLHATTRDDKHWPETHWRRLIELMQPCGIHIKLPWGAEHERQRAERLAAGFSHVEVLPKLTLAQVAAQLAGANAVVSVDTGLSHLTAALDRPNITIFGPTDPGLIGVTVKTSIRWSALRNKRRILAQMLFFHFYRAAIGFPTGIFNP